MAVYNLSAFRQPAPGKPGVTFAAPSRAGEWTPLGGSLGELGDALDVNDDARVDAVRATPDPWAQARVFADALLYPGALLGDVIGQWRGLLALFAFADTYRDVYTLGLAPVPLGQGGTRFAAIMARLLPARALPLPPGDIAADWNRPVVVRLTARMGTAATPETRPIALLNPACLIAAGRDVETLRVPGVPWMAGGLGDPTALAGEAALSLDEVRMLHAYVQTLEADLARLIGPRGDEDETWMRLRTQLKDYARDCLDPARQPGAANHAVKVRSAEAFGEGLPPVYRLMRRAVTAAPPELGTSHCRIDLRADIGVAPFHGLVLLDPSIAATLGRPANRIVLWGRTTLRAALDGGPAFAAALAREIAAAGWLLVRPQDFFTPVLARMNIPGRDGRIAAHPDAFADALLPLSPLSLLIAGPARLRSAVTLDADGYVRLAVDLPGAGARHRIGHRYARAPGAGEDLLLDEVDLGLGDVALWPDFRSDRWQRYFARVTFPVETEQRLRGRIATSGAALAAMLAATGGEDDPAARADAFAVWTSRAPFPGGDDPLPPFATRASIDPWGARLRGREAREGAAVEVQASDKPFEAVLFSVIVARDVPPVPAGIALVLLAETRAPPTRAGVIAVDFGTTNTVACIDTEEPAELRMRIVQPIASGDKGFTARSADNIEKNFQDFLPPRARTLPTPSVVIERDLDTAGEAAMRDPRVEAHILFRHLAYFQPLADARARVRDLSIGDWHSLLGRAVFNLKWTHDPAGIVAAERYLRQIAMMLAAEAVDAGHDPAKLEWRFSRPDGMRGADNFREALHRALADAVPGTTRAQLAPLRSEGLSAANYILTTRPGRAFSRLDLNVILDIGGGTTDIALWNNAVPEPALVWQGSVRLAGGDFFTRHIVANPDVLGLFGLDAWAAVLRCGAAGEVGVGGARGEAIDPAKLSYVGELLFSGGTLDRAIGESWYKVAADEGVRRLLETAFVYLAGIAWHIGRVAGTLVADGALRADALGHIAVALCGRGAGLFARVQGADRPGEPTEVSRLLALIAAAAGRAGPPVLSVFVSPSPKIEVAAGMIGGAGPRTRASASAAAGSADLYRVPANDPWGVAMAAEDLPEWDRPPSEVAADPFGIADMGPFLAALAEHADFAVTLSPLQKKRLQSGMIDAEAADRAEGRIVQPRFIGALKMLVSMMTEPGGSAARPTVARRAR